MSQDNASDDLENSSGERQPWDPPTEEETKKAVNEALAVHLTPPVEGDGEKEQPSEEAIPKGGEEKQEEKQKENAEEKSESKEEEGSKEKKEEGQNAEVPEALPQTVEEKPGRLEKRIAKLYINNLTLSEREAPDIQEVLKELTSGKYTHEQKMQMLHLHRKENKELRGMDIRKRDPEDEEDAQIVRESEREQMRREIQQEERQKVAEKTFVQFLNAHPELDEEKKEYNPMLARAVETLWKGGMLIQDAYATVTSQLDEVREEQEKLQLKGKRKALSGAMSVSSQSKAPKDENEYTWTEFNQLMMDDPAKWQSLVEKGYKPKS